MAYVNHAIGNQKLRTLIARLSDKMADLKPSGMPYDRMRDIRHKLATELTLRNEWHDNLPFGKRHLWQVIRDRSGSYKGCPDLERRAHRELRTHFEKIWAMAHNPKAMSVRDYMNLDRMVRNGWKG